jgi:hypothetical protein
MKRVTAPLSVQRIDNIKKKYGDYIKITADIEKNEVVIGCELHADGEKILLNNGSKQDNIWGGGLDFISREVDATAVLNLRPGLDNNSLEILDQQRRTKFLNIVKNIFTLLWQN